MVQSVKDKYHSGHSHKVFHINTMKAYGGVEVYLHPGVHKLWANEFGMSVPRNLRWLLDDTKVCAPQASTILNLGPRAR